MSSQTRNTKGARDREGHYSVSAHKFGFPLNLELVRAKNSTRGYGFMSCEHHSVAHVILHSCFVVAVVVDSNSTNYAGNCLFGSGNMSGRE